MKKIPEVRKQEFINYYNKGLNDYEIARAMNISDSTTFRWRKSFGLPPLYTRKLRRNKPIEISDEQYEILCGTLLGDSTLEYYPNKGQRSPRFKCEHGVQQKEYAEYLCQKLSSLGTSLKENKRLDKRSNKQYTSYTLRSLTNPSFLPLHNILYKEGRKVISKEFLAYFTIKSLAYLYMDDGYCDQNTAYLCTDCFSEEDLNTMSIFLKERFNLQFNIVCFGKNHGKRLRLLHKDFERFQELVKPYIIESLRYKLKTVS